ncbi:MAG: PAS domain-containing protein, partial [Deltaproteobacteria bacterium]|nr:PAS domain-containing protein [Deltaproteobacteria bacterium]
MRNIVPSSIRSKLIFLGVLAFIPVALLMFYNSWQQTRAEIEKETARMRNILDFVVLHEEEVIRATHRLMAALAEVPEVREGGKRCGEFMNGVLAGSPGYVNFGVARLDGQVVCSGFPLEKPLNVHDLSHFQGALRDRSFTVGRYSMSVRGGKSTLPFAYPVTDERGRLSSVLLASIDQSAVTEMEAEIKGQAPDGTICMRLDEDGTVLSAFPASPAFPVGKAIGPSVIGRMSGKRNGTFRARGPDGVERLMVFSSLRGQSFDRGGVVLLGVPIATFSAEPVRLLVRSLTVLSLVALITFAIVWFAGNVLIVRPMQTLTDASKRMAAGDLSVRTGLESVPGEFGQLGRTFDEAVDALERGQAESRGMQERLRAAVAEARNERARSEAIIAAIGEGINIVDRNFRVLYQNEVHKSRVGDHAGESCYKAYHGSDGVCQGCVADLSFRTGKIHTGELEGTRGGKPYCNEVTASPLRDASGEIVAAIEVVRDIKERKEAERRVGKSVGMLSALHTVDLNILRGVALDDTLGVVCDAIVRMGFRACWVALAERDYSGRVAVARGDRKEIFEELDIRWDDTPKGRGAFGTVVRTGRTFLCGDIPADPRFDPWKDTFAECGLRSLLSVPLKSDDGTVVGALIVCSDRPDGFTPADVGDLETFAQQCAVAALGAKWIENLRDANQRLLFHVNRMPMGYVVWDADFRVSEWNPAAERIFGWTAGEAVGRTGMEFLIPDEEKPGIRQLWERLLGGEESHSLNSNLRKDGGKIRCEWFNGPLQDNEGKVVGVLSIVHDVTEKVYLERQLQIAQRMEAVGTLAGGVAHDFNNALTGIFGFGEMLRPYLKGDGTATSYLNEVMRSAERAATLTRQLLTYSRRQ